MDLRRQLRKRSSVGVGTFPVNSLEPLPPRTIKISVGINRPEHFFAQELDAALAGFPAEQRNLLEQALTEDRRAEDGNRLGK
jgi:hypothetical protein